jgi:ferredoxin
MPWVDKNECTGCGTCVEECPVNAIAMKNEKAEIDMDQCIRCGICHKVCPEHAVKHDSEKIPQEVEVNVEKVKEYMEHFKNEEEKQACLKRSMNFFKKERTVAERTLEELEKMRKTQEKNNHE